MDTQQVKHTPKVDYIYMITFLVLSIGIQICKQVVKFDFSDQMWTMVGAVLLVIGIFTSFYEKYRSFRLMTLEDRNNLLVIDSCIPGTLGVVLLCDGYVMNIAVTVAVLAVIGAGRYFLDKKRCDKFNANIGKKGVAETQITDVGKMRMADDTVIDVIVTDGQIKKGQKIVITGMVGYALVVERTGKKK